MNTSVLDFLRQVTAITCLAAAVCIFGMSNGGTVGDGNSPAASAPVEGRKVEGSKVEAAPVEPAAALSPPGRPALPALYLDTTYMAPTGRKIAVAAGARNLQAALDAASPGDTLLLEAGATFTGNFTLPKKAGNNWIIIRSAVPDSELPPAGTRLTPSAAVRLAKLVSPNADPVLQTAAGAHHYRFIGLEFTVNPAQSITFDLIRFGSIEQTALADVPRDLILDRCYIHGNPKTNLRRGVALHSARTAIIDSYISDCHERGAEAQAICGWNGPGPFKIVNNYLEGAGENVMFGGADPRIEKLVPSDIEFRRNHCFKPLAWKKGHESYAGQAWSVKNIFELKSARRVLVDGNLFENNWVDAQSGYAILFTVRNQDGGAPWSVIEDVTFTNNILRNTPAAFNILGRDTNHPSEQGRRILIQNNLIHNVGGKQWGGNGCFLLISETLDVVVDHNTVLHRGNVITAYGAPNEGFVFTNNLVPHNDYGVMGDNMSPGNVTLNKFFPNLIFKKNVLAGGRSSIYPPDNYFDNFFENFLSAAPDSVARDEVKEQNFRLPANSAFKKAGTDSRDIGCDLSAIEVARSRPTLTSSTPAAAASTVLR